MARTWTLFDTIALPAGDEIAPSYPCSDLTGNHIYFLGRDTGGKNVGEFIYEYNVSTKAITDITGAAFYEIHDIIYWKNTLFCVWTDGWTGGGLPVANNTYVAIWNGGTSWTSVYNVRTETAARDAMSYSQVTQNCPLAADANRIVLAGASRFHMSTDGINWTIQTIAGDYTTYTGQQRAFGNILARPQISYDEVVVFTRKGASDFWIAKHSAGNNWTLLNSSTIAWQTQGYFDGQHMDIEFVGGWKLYYYNGGGNGWEDGNVYTGLVAGSSDLLPMQYFSADGKWILNNLMRLWNDGTKSFDGDGTLGATGVPVGAAVQYPNTVYVFCQNAQVYTSTIILPPQPSGDNRLWIYRSSPDVLDWSSIGVTTP